MGFDDKMEWSERVADMMAESDQRLERIEDRQPPFFLGYPLHACLGYAVYLMVHLLGLVLILAFWSEPKLAAILLLPAIPAAFFGMRASYLAERHIYWIVGELRRGRG